MTNIETLLFEIEERVANIRVLLAAREQMELFPKRAARPRSKMKVDEAEEVNMIDFAAIWSEARRDSHYMKPWLIPKGSEQEKKLLAVARTIQEQYPRHAEQTFYATCEKYFECQEPSITATKHCLPFFCFRFNEFLQFRPKVETSHDGQITKAGYTGSGQWVEPKVLAQV